MKKPLSLSLLMLVIVGCGKAGKMPLFPSPQLSPLTVELPPQNDEEIVVKVERMDELKADFSNYEKFVSSLNFHRIIFKPKQGSLAGFSVQCHDPSEGKVSYYSETVQEDLIVLTHLKFTDLSPVDLECILSGKSRQFVKIVPMKKSLVNPISYDSPLDLDVLLLDKRTLLTYGKEVSIKANKFVFREGIIAPSLVTSMYPQSGPPSPSGNIQLEAKEVLGELTVNLIGESSPLTESPGEAGGDTGGLLFKLSHMDQFKLQVNYYPGEGGPGNLFQNGTEGPRDNGKSRPSRIELTDKKEIIEFDTDWAN